MIRAGLLNLLQETLRERGPFGVGLAVGTGEKFSDGLLEGREADASGQLRIEQFHCELHLLCLVVAAEPHHLLNFEELLPRHLAVAR